MHEISRGARVALRSILSFGVLVGALRISPMLLATASLTAELATADESRQAAHSPTASPVLHGTATTALAVSVTVPSTCTVTATAMRFGEYSSGQAGTGDATSTVTATCSSDAAVTVSANIGLHGASTQRKLSNGSHTLDYNMYTDADDTRIWGDGTGSTTMFGPATTSGRTATFTARGRIPGSQPADAGTTYTDTVTVTVSF